jgi:hypothetical protein
MFDTTDYYIAAEIAYRHERVADDWAAANSPYVRGGRLRRGSQRHRRTGSRLHQQSTGRATVA